MARCWLLVQVFYVIRASGTRKFTWDGAKMGRTYLTHEQEGDFHCFQCLLVQVVRSPGGKVQPRQVFRMVLTGINY